jgi:hypothetical protein
MQSQPDDEWHELWGTFSVRDHCQPGAFIAEALLYDRLVIPVVPTVDDAVRDAQARGGVIDDDKAAAWAKEEWDRWKREGWDPSRQSLLIALLKRTDRLELIPWTATLQAEWRAEMARTFQAARRDGFFTTGSVLQGLAPRLAKTVVAVSQYRSLAELEEKEKIRRQEPHRPLPSSTLLAVLGHELLLPVDPGQDDFRHLEEALEVGSDPKYRECRRALYRWQQRFVREDLTDARSITSAVNEMTDLVDRLKNATASQKRWKWIKRFFSFVGLGGKAAVLGPAAAAVGAAGSALASVGTFVADEWAPRGTALAGLPVATLVVDARERLGIE